MSSSTLWSWGGISCVLCVIDLFWALEAGGGGGCIGKALTNKCQWIKIKIKGTALFIVANLSISTPQSISTLEQLPTLIFMEIRITPLTQMGQIFRDGASIFVEFLLNFILWSYARITSKSSESAILHIIIGNYVISGVINVLLNKYNLYFPCKIFSSQACYTHCRKNNS